MAAKNNNKKVKKRSWREFWGLVWLRMQEVKVKVGVFIFLVLYICLLIGTTYKEFRCDDPIPPVKTLYRQMRRQFKDLSSRVRVGLFIRDFSEFSFAKNQFTIDALVWFEYKKNELRREIIDKFSFDNAKIINRSEPTVKLHNDMVLVTYNVTFEAKTNLNYRLFPLQDHRLSIVLTNNFTSPSELYFDDDVDSISLKISKNVYTPHWTLKRLSTYSGFYQLDFDNFRKNRTIINPKVVFTLDFFRAGIKDLLVIFLPLFTTIFLSMFTFMLSFNNYIGKLSVSVTSLTALLGYRFVIEQLIPKVGYLTLTDKLYLLFLVFCFFIFVLQLLLARQYLFLVEHSKQLKQEMSEVDVATITPRTSESIATILFFLLVAILMLLLTLMFRM